ncbi:MAG: hypothetical protein AB7O62_23095 [Pirellulales bacterium]
MHQIKIFKSVESEITSLESQVNRWLYDSKARVVQMFGNIAPQTVAHETTGLNDGGFSPSDVLLVVLYEEPL